MIRYRSSILICKIFLTRNSFGGTKVPFSTRALSPSHSHVKVVESTASRLLRKYYSVGEVVDREVDVINLKFAEAREEIESAMESKETVYFNEEAECAREAVAQVVQLYEGLLNKVSDNERGAIQRSMGLKIEQLKAELRQLDE